MHVPNVPVPAPVRAASSAETKTAARFSEAAALLSADCIGQMSLSLLDVRLLPNVPVPLGGWETAVGAYASALAVMMKVVEAGMLLALPQKAPLLLA